MFEIYVAIRGERMLDVSELCRRELPGLAIRGEKMPDGGKLQSHNLWKTRRYV
jgi:hypothetical protein